MGVLGPSSRTFFVSSNAVYLWTHEHSEWSWLPEDDDPAADAALYRFPLDGSRPQAVRTRGAPIDQMSFQADAGRGALNVLVQSTGAGDAMWNPEFQDGSLALLRLPMSRFGDGRGEAPRSDYRVLPDLPKAPGIGGTASSTGTCCTPVTEGRGSSGCRASSPPTSTRGPRGHGICRRASAV
jgi:hypothetical protein